MKNAPPSSRPAMLYTGSDVAKRWNPALTHFHTPGATKLST